MICFSLCAITGTVCPFPPASPPGAQGLEQQQGTKLQVPHVCLRLKYLARGTIRWASEMRIGAQTHHISIFTHSVNFGVCGMPALGSGRVAAGPQCMVRGVTEHNEGVFGRWWHVGCKLCGTCCPLLATCDLLGSDPQFEEQSEPILVKKSSNRVVLRPLAQTMTPGKLVWIYMKLANPILLEANIPVLYQHPTKHQMLAWKQLQQKLSSNDWQEVSVRDSQEERKSGEVLWSWQRWWFEGQQHSCRCCAFLSGFSCCSWLAALSLVIPGQWLPFLLLSAASSCRNKSVLCGRCSVAYQASYRCSDLV